MVKVAKAVVTAGVIEAVVLTGMTGRRVAEVGVGGGGGIDVDGIDVTRRINRGLCGSLGCSVIAGGCYDTDNGAGVVASW